jgi:hypothetical protein
MNGGQGPHWSSVSWTVRLSAGSVAGDWAWAAAHAATSRTDRKTRVALDFRLGILDLLLWLWYGGMPYR